jgi:4-hydroxy-tetrahydrodipicolinate reductase
MGRLVISLVRELRDGKVVGAIEAADHPLLGRDAGEVAGGPALGVAISDDHASLARPDTVTLDFTIAAGALEHLREAARKKAAIVVGTTGFTPAERKEAEELARKTRTIIAANMSVGVNVLLELVESAARLLGPSFDPEIVEMHHRMKVDAPSGTALALAQAAARALDRDLAKSQVSARQGMTGKRTDQEIGIMALRGGDVVGDHTVVFAGMGERLELTHRAQSRDCLARGAVRAGLWLVKQKKPGLYSMADVLGLR